MSQEVLVQASGLQSELSEVSLSNALPALPEDKEVNTTDDEGGGGGGAVASTSIGFDSTIDITTHSTSLSTFLEQDQDAVDGIESHRRTYSRASSIVSSKTIGTSNNPDIPAAASGSENDEEDDDDDHEAGVSSSRILLGICAMDKKARSKPMAEILSRLDDNLFKVIFFGDEVILNQPIEDWPICDVIIAFFSKGYPLRKAMDYVELRKPLILNDLGMQELMQDRRRVYDLLEASGIDVPRHVYLSKDGYVSTGTGDGNGARDQEVQEFDDHIEVNGVVIHKPFVEKPVDAEDHSLAVYFPTSAGGGCKKLFRKIGNRSSEFYPDVNEVRRDGSYIYEEFVETQGTDVKMYTVGPEYGHAEARKSPTVDGKVERNPDGKEVRFPVILTYREKEIARRVVLNFKQFVCGFDILRVQEGHSVVSYVCDVNGWSFVKKSRKYYDDCAQILSEHILAKLRPAELKTFSTLDPLVTMKNNIGDDDSLDDNRRVTILSRAVRMLQGEPAQEEDPATSAENSSSPARLEAATLDEGALPVREFPSNLTSEPASLCQSANSSVVEGVSEAKQKCVTTSLKGPHREELRCVVAIIRHGDRTPKQKLKINIREPHILQFFHDHVGDNCKKDLKVKAKAPMTEFLRTIKTTLAELTRESDSEGLRYKFMHMRDILERWKIVGLNRKLQIKPRKFEEYIDENGVSKERCTEVQLILKWGGNLTKLGEKQAIHLGQHLRHEMYPDAPGGGILRLHSTFRHDLKIKTSDEGRVMKTAAAFAKGLLELEGDLPPILVSLVHKEKGSMHMLDPSGNKEVKMELDECKERITANLQKDIDLVDASEEELEQIAGPPELTSLRDALFKIKNPRKTLVKIHELMGELISQLDEMLDEMGSGDEKRIEGGEGLKGKADDEGALSGVKLYKGETLLELTERWKFIYDRLYDPETDMFDLSRIPDVHDNVRFDVLHNPHLGLTNTLHRLYDLAKVMADCVVPQEYGTTIAEKRSVGVKICHGLLEKIKYDLDVARKDNDVDMRYLINMAYSADMNINSMGRRVRTRLYFTSESHLHTVLSVFRFACEEDQKSILSDRGVAIINSTPELCYLTQIVMRVFEDARRDIDDPRRFRVEILFSPGATATPFHMHEQERESDTSRFGTAPLQMIGREGLTCQDVEDFFEKVIKMADKNDDNEEKVEEPSKDVPPEGTENASPERTETPGRSEVKEEKTEEELAPAPMDESAEETNRESALPTQVTIDTRHEPEKASDVSPAGINRSPPAENDPAQDKKHGDGRGRLVSGRKYFWGAVAVGSFALGMSCLVMALRLSEDRRPRRRWTSR